MNILTVINKKKMYTITQAYQTNKDSLEGNVCYNTFYKKFTKWKEENNIQGIKIKEHSHLYYSEKQISNFLEAFPFIFRYNKPINNTPLNSTIPSNF